MEHRELQCCVCDDDYSEVLPRNLGCGHSVCSNCVEFIISTNKRCPECRSPFVGNSASELPVNHSLLRLSRVFALGQLDSDIKPKPKLLLSFPLPEPKQNAGKCHAHSCSMFFMCLPCLVPVCRNCLMEDHKDPPFGQCLVLSIAEAMDKIKNSYTRTTDTYLVKAQASLLKLKKEQKALSISLKAFESIRHGGDLVSAKEDLEELNQRHEAILSNLATLESLIDSLKDASQRLADASSPENIKILVKNIADCHTTFEKYEKTNEKRIQNILQILLGNDKDLKHLVETGKPTYAVIEDEETTKWTLLSIRNHELHLYSLRDGKPPDNGICLPFCLVRELVPKEYPVIFLVVGWHGKVRGHVYVRMFQDTPRSRQTIFLCSGEKGPSYKNTRFYKQSHFRLDSVLCGGDYENNDGSGGRAIVGGITCGGPYVQVLRAGLFVGWNCKEHWRLGSFNIHLNDIPGIYHRRGHGRVEHGLEILKEVVGLFPDTDSFVMDCGLVIPT